jgi:amidohydrolase
MRLVPNQEPEEIAQLLKNYIAKITRPGIRSKLKFTGASRPVLLPKNSPAMVAVVRAISQTWGVPPVFTRTGGTIPLVERLYRRMRIPIVLMGFGLPDDDIHAPNEKIDLRNFFRGVETVIRFLAECAR